MGAGMYSGGIVAGHAEHHSLVTRTAVVDAGRDLGGLPDDRDLAFGAVPPVHRRLVTDAADHPAHQLGDIGEAVRPDFARDYHPVRRQQRLAGHPTLGIPAQDFVHNGVRNLVGNLVGMPLGN